MSATFAAETRNHLGEHLRNLYRELIGDTVPPDLARLVRRLERAIQARGEEPDPKFMEQLLECAPSLRAFAMSLTRNMEQAEDLVQDTMLKAWDKRSSFQPGTNLNAWLFTILRNAFYSEHRKKGREVEDSDGSYAASQVTMPDQIDRLNLQDLSAALDKMSPDQRQALLLVGAEGMSYEEAARAMGVAIGTAKSRVNRARVRLAQLLGLENESELVFPD